MSWSLALLAVTAFHAGFQLTVTLLVYPALTRTPADRWAAAHLRHSTAITPLVVIIYGLALIVAVGSVWSAPSRPLVWVAATATVVIIVLTATRAGPLHVKLGRLGPEPGLIRQLVIIDRVRTALALTALVAAAYSTWNWI